MVSKLGQIEFRFPSAHRPAERAGVDVNLTENRIRPKISTLAGPFGAAHNTVGGNLVMAFAQMITEQSLSVDPLLTVEDVAERLKVSRDWVWDHSSRKAPYLPVIRMGDGALRYRASKIEAFIDERERLAGLRLRRK